MSVMAFQPYISDICWCCVPMTTAAQISDFVNASYFEIFFIV